MTDAVGKRLDVDPKSGLPRLESGLFWLTYPSGKNLRMEIRRKSAIGSRLVIGGYAHLRRGEEEIPSQRVWETAVTLLWQMAIQSQKPSRYLAQRFAEE